MNERLKQHIADLRDNRIPRVQRQLAPLKDGSMHIYSGSGSGPKNDITQQEMGRLEAEIAIYERIIAEFEAITASD